MSERPIDVVELRGAGLLLEAGAGEVSVRVLRARREVPVREGLASREQVWGGADPSPGVYRGVFRGLLFETNKTFLLPGAVGGLRALERWYRAHPGLELLLVGHADRSGEDEYNRALSQERAEAVAAFLRDDAAAWLSWFDAARGSKQWGTREDQHMLSLLSDEEGPFYAGAVDGAAGPGTRAALERFQRWSNAARGASLTVDGVSGPNTRAELVPAYMAQDHTTLPAGTQIRAHGCGEWHPEVATADGVSEEQNRRVEVFGFAGGVQPPPQDPCPAGGCAEHAQWCEAIAEEIDLSESAGQDLQLRLDVDPARPEHASDRFRLFASEGSWEQVLGLADDQLAGDQYVDLIFTGVDPGLSYSLEVDPGPQGSPYLVFSQVPFAELATTPGLREPRQASLWYEVDA